MPANEQSAAARLAFSDLWQSNSKCFALWPMRKPNSSILGILPKTTTLSLVCRAFLEPIVHNHPLLLIGHFDRFKIHLSNGKEKNDGSASHPLWNNSCVCYLTLLMSAKVDRMVSINLDENVSLGQLQTSGVGSVL